MRFKIIILFLFGSLFNSDVSFGQHAIAEKDSNQFYEQIESYARRTKFTKFIYRFIFRAPQSEIPKNAAEKKVIVKKPTKWSKKPNTNFEGKIIRHINIETLDPFGHVVGDTIVAPQNFFLRSGNKIHIKTQRKIIRNLLLIHKNQAFDSLLVKESERLIRAQNYVKDVSFYTVLVSKKSDSVDIYIRELDKWSMVAAVGASPSQVIVKVVEKNFLGIGHESENKYTWYHRTGEDAFNTNYYIPNIRNTYINTTLHYGTDEYRNSVRSLIIDRPFFSPFAKWAWGANLNQTMHRDSFSIGNQQSIFQKFKINTQDYWLGNSMQIFKGNSENNRSTNFISALRFVRATYSEKPDLKYDTSHVYAPSDTYLGNVGISTRKYVQDTYILKFGVPEDVPVGKVYSITGAYQEQHNVGHMYLGARASFGNFYNWGYLSSNCEYGTVFRSTKPSQGILSLSVIYFTHLVELGKWKFREFAKPQATFGLSRAKGEGLTLNDGYGIDGFNSSGLLGANRLLLKLQTQSYAPWKIIGFRLGPYLVYSIGMLSNENTGFSRSKVYSQVGIGFLIKNENLVFNSLQFSVSFYPLIPGYKQDAFKINSFKTGDFGFRDFEIGQPAMLGYQ